MVLLSVAELGNIGQLEGGGRCGPVTAKPPQRTPVVNQRIGQYLAPAPTSHQELSPTASPFQRSFPNT